MGKELEQAFFQRSYTNGQQVHKKVLNITNHERDANQNHNELSSQTCQNGYLKNKRL